MKNSARDLMASYIDALYPIIYINHFDFKVIDEIITDITDNRKVVEYNNGLGIVDFKTKSTMKECDLYNFLNLVNDIVNLFLGTVGMTDKYTAVFFAFHCLSKKLL